MHPIDQNVPSSSNRIKDGIDNFLSTDSLSTAIEIVFQCLWMLDTLQYHCKCKFLSIRIAQGRARATSWNPKATLNIFNRFRDHLRSDHDLCEVKIETICADEPKKRSVGPCHARWSASLRHATIPLLHDIPTSVSTNRTYFSLSYHGVTFQFVHLLSFTL